MSGFTSLGLTHPADSAGRRGTRSLVALPILAAVTVLVAAAALSFGAIPTPSPWFWVGSTAVWTVSTRVEDGTPQSLFTKTIFTVPPPFQTGNTFTAPTP